MNFGAEFADRLAFAHFVTTHWPRMPGRPSDLEWAPTIRTTSTGTCVDARESTFERNDPESLRNPLGRQPSLKWLENS